MVCLWWFSLCQYGPWKRSRRFVFNYLSWRMGTWHMAGTYISFSNVVYSESINENPGGLPGQWSFAAGWMASSPTGFSFPKGWIPRSTNPKDQSGFKMVSWLGWMMVPFWWLWQHSLWQLHTITVHLLENGTLLATKAPRLQAPNFQVLSIETSHEFSHFLWRSYVCICLYSLFDLFGRHFRISTATKFGHRTLFLQGTVPGQRLVELGGTRRLTWLIRLSYHLYEKTK